MEQVGDETAVHIVLRNSSYFVINARLTKKILSEKTVGTDRKSYVDSRCRSIKERSSEPQIL